ncbi:Na+/H+ antiporter NhaC [Ignatzschineria sp. LJL83]
MSCCDNDKLTKDEVFIVRDKPLPSLTIALIPIISMMVLLFTGIFVFGAEPHIPILLSAVIAGIVAIYLGYTWTEIEKGITAGVALSVQALLILIILGTLIATWLAGGIVPTMIYYGLNILSPEWFLPLAVIITSAVSLTAGNAWTAAGTVGIAVMGVGIVLGYSPAMVAGAVISGAYFGDKISPLSETTNMAPGIIGVNLFEHIRYMLYTTIPSWVLTIIMFFILGIFFKAESGDISDITLLQSQLKEIFVITPWLILVPVTVLGLIMFRVPAIPGLVIGSLLGGAVAFFVQGETMTSILNMTIVGYEKETGNEMIDYLLNNGGMEAMMPTVSLVMLAMSLGGILELTGALETIVNRLLRFACSTGSLIATTAASSVTANVIACDQYLSILLPGRMYVQAYKDQGLELKNLSRTVEDAGTMTSSLVPWNTCGAFMATTLGVATIDYAPFVFIAFLSPLVAIIYGYTGYKIARVPKAERTEGAVELDTSGSVLIDANPALTVEDMSQHKPA